MGGEVSYVALGIGLSGSGALPVKVGHRAGRDSEQVRGREQDLAGTAIDVTYRVCSFGRYWNADLPTNWIGLS